MPGLQIIGAGNSQVARVNSLGELQVESTTMTLPHNINLNHELAYVLTFTVTPSADEYFLFIENNSENELIIESVTICGAGASDPADEFVELFVNVDGSPTGGNSIKPINSNLGSNKIASGVFEYGQSLGGLSGGKSYGISSVPAGQIVKQVFDN